MKVFHVTRRRNLLAIRRHGLIPRDTTQHNFSYVDKGAGVEAVYAFPSRERAVNYAGILRDYFNEPVAVVKVQAKGLRREPDPSDVGWFAPLRGAIRITEPVPPERVVGVVAYA